MPPPLPEGYVCAPYTVPGWLGEDGLPTSCVGDHPCPGFDSAGCSVGDNAGRPVVSIPGLQSPIALYPDPLPLSPPVASEGVPANPSPTAELAQTGLVDGVGWDWVVVALLLVGVGFFFKANQRKR